MSTHSYSIAGATLDRSSGQWGTKTVRRDHAWRAGHQSGMVVVALTGDCSQSIQWPQDAAHNPRRTITPREEARVIAKAVGYRVQASSYENACRSVYAHLTGRAEYTTEAGRLARVRLETTAQAAARLC